MPLKTELNYIHASFIVSMNQGQYTLGNHALCHHLYMIFALFGCGGLGIMICEG